MSRIFENCPVPDLRACKFEVNTMTLFETSFSRQYSDKFGATVNGVIISIYKAVEGLFYMIDETMFHHLSSIGSFQPSANSEFKKPPRFGEIFLYVNNDQKTFRACRLPSNPVNNQDIRFYLLDLGIVMFINFAPKHFFRFPDEFNLINPMAIFCKLELPTPGLKSEFLEYCLEKTVKFKVLQETKVDNAIGIRRFCLVVGVDESDETLEEQMRRSVKDETQEDDLQLTYPATYIPLTAQDISHDHETLVAGSKILLYDAYVDTPITFWACIKTQNNLTTELMPKSADMHSLMNASNAVIKYKKLMVNHKEGDMVIADGSDFKKHRGLIKKLTDQGSRCNVR